MNVEIGQAIREDVEPAMRAILGALASWARATLNDDFLDEAWPALLAKLGPAGALGEALGRWSEADPAPMVLLVDEIRRAGRRHRASALRFGDPRVQALFAALLRFDLLPHGFRNRELREAVASLCGLSLDDYSAGRTTYDLRRLRLRGLIERIPRTRRYRLTAEGVCIALAYHRTAARVLRPALSAALDGDSPTRLNRAVADYDREIQRLHEGQALAA